MEFSKKMGKPDSDIILLWALVYLISAVEHRDAREIRDTARGLDRALRDLDLLH